MKHIGPLRLYKLRRKCLEIKLWGKKISQCLYYALSKTCQEILQKLSTNKARWLFYQVFIDWLDLKERLNSY